MEPPATNDISRLFRPYAPKIIGASAIETRFIALGLMDPESQQNYP